MTTLFAPEHVAAACPISAARAGVSSMLARARIPELPNNFEVKLSTSHILFSRQRMIYVLKIQAMSRVLG
jgi:hypothetical protein